MKKIQIVIHVFNTIFLQNKRLALQLKMFYFLQK